MADAAPARKILLCGDVGGSLHALYKRFETVNKAAGPFEAIFCVGRFCGAEEGACGDLRAFVDGAASAPVPTFFVDGLPGAKGILDSALLPADGTVAPNLTFLRGSGLRTVAGLRVAFVSGHFEPLSYRDASAAGALGAAAAGELRAADVAALLRTAEADPEPVDLLLTCEWPRHVVAAAGAPLPPPEVAAASISGAAPLAELAAAVAPRYHAAAAAGVFYARPPYRNRRGGLTRFVGLSRIGAPAGQKWLHALNMVPAASMTAQQLSAGTTDTTPSPYIAAAAPPPGPPPGGPPAGGPPGAEGGQSWRWAPPPPPRERPPKRPRPDDAGEQKVECTVFVRNLAFAAGEDAIREFFAAAGEVLEVRIGTSADGRPRGYAHVDFRTKEAAEAAMAMGGQQLMDREIKVEAATERGERPAQRNAPRVAAPGEPAPGCWFCLSNAKDTHLIASIASETYVALDKGALCEQHVLIVPVEHYPSTASLPSGAAEEAWRYAAALRRCFAAALGGSQLVCFERHLALRGKGGNHAHVNCVPLPPAAAARARGAFETAAQRAGFAFVHLPPPPAAPEAAQQLAAAVGGAEFFAVTLPDGSRLVHPLAQGERMNMQFGREVLAELLGTPEKADWRQCTLDTAGEEARAAAFKDLFAAHDPFMAEGA